MAFVNVRNQHSVGQGFFHSARLLENKSERLRYVYDCGSATKYAEARNNRIDKYISAFNQDNRHLDIAFISHAHADHVNGLSQLLDLTTGLKVDTIVLPYFNVVERLISFAYCTNTDPAATKEKFYQRFVSDPIGTLSNFEPRQIIQIRSAGGESPGSPGSGGEPIGPAPDIFGSRGSEEGVTWKLVGRGKVIQESGRRSEKESQEVRVFTIEDSMGIATLACNSKTNFWLLSPFIDPAIEAMQMAFKTALLKALNHGKARNQKVKKADFDNWLRDKNNIENILINNLADLQEAYSHIEKNINFSSMCLYSGPPSDADVSSQMCHSKFGKWDVTSNERIGWLATGDADLKTKSRRLAFFKHYQKLMKNVLTLTIPHHGSENNFDPDLLIKIDPMFCIVAADTVGNWRHPGTKIVQSVASQGRFISVVTSSPCSEICENAFIE